VVSVVGVQVALTDDFVPNEGVTPESYITTICAIVGDSSTNPEPTQVTIGGQSWTKMECESLDGSSHTVVEAVTYKDKMVSLLFSSDAASFAQDQSKYFSIMEQTFTFLS
jgi:hypothetical protein